MRADPDPEELSQHTVPLEARARPSRWGDRAHATTYACSTPLGKRAGAERQRGALCAPRQAILQKSRKGLIGKAELVLEAKRWLFFLSASTSLFSDHTDISTSEATPQADLPELSRKQNGGNFPQGDPSPCEYIAGPPSVMASHARRKAEPGYGQASALGAESRRGPEGPTPSSVTEQETDAPSV